MVLVLALPAQPDCITPVLANNIVFDGTAHQRCKQWPLAGRTEASQFPSWKIAQSGCKFQTQQMEQRKDMVRHAARI